MKLLLTLALLLATASAHAAEPKPLVIVQAGTLPILLTAPHGGKERVPGVPERKTGVRTIDSGTLELALTVADGIGRALGGKPYVVAARFHRKFIDANRSEAEALEDPRAQATYRTYHDAVRAFVDELRQRYNGQAILLDIHGQSMGPETIFRGTQNGKTVDRLLRRAGYEALAGSKSIFGGLTAHGYTVNPDLSAPQGAREHKQYGGGFTVQTYSGANGIDAIQLEFGSGLRKRPTLAADAAASVVVFAKAYLPVGPSAAPSR